MSMPFFQKPPCNHCSQMDFRNVKLTNLLGWLCNRLQSVAGDNMTDLLAENCELNNWWNERRRLYQLELQQQAEEQRKQSVAKGALNKLNQEERKLLQLHVQNGGSLE